jgi:hypothetical protein
MGGTYCVITLSISWKVFSGTNTLAYFAGKTASMKNNSIKLAEAIPIKLFRKIASFTIKNIYSIAHKWCSLEIRVSPKIYLLVWLLIYEFQ